MDSMLWWQDRIEVGKPWGQQKQCASTVQKAPSFGAYVLASATLFSTLMAVMDVKRFGVFCFTAMVACIGRILRSVSRKTESGSIRCKFVTPKSSINSPNVNTHLPWRWLWNTNHVMLESWCRFRIATGELLICRRHRRHATKPKDTWNTLKYFEIQFYMWRQGLLSL